MTDREREERFRVESARPGELRLVGEIDLSVVDSLSGAIARELGDEPAGGLILDLRDLRFLDSSGLRVILETARRLPGDLVLRHPAPGVRRLLSVAGVSDLPGIVVE